MFYRERVPRSKSNSQSVTLNLAKRGPIAETKYRPSHSPNAHKPELVPVHIIRVYQGDWVCVRFVQENYHFGREGHWMVRGGVQWPTYLKRLVQCYRYNRGIPQDFMCSKRLPEKLLEQLEQVASQYPSQLLEVFQKLRDCGFLPFLSKLTASSCPKVLNWTTIQNHYQDFIREGTE